MSQNPLIKNVSPEDVAQYTKFYPGENKGRIRAGQKGYMFPKGMQYGLEQIYNMEIRPTDVFVVTFPRSGENKGRIRAGQKGYMFPKGMQYGLEQIYNMEIRPTDVFVVTFPRSGTTWSQEMVWLILNNLNFEQAKAIPLRIRFPFIEYPYVYSDNLEATLKRLKKESKTDAGKMKMYERLQTESQESLSAASNPRFLKSHLALELLPPDLLEKGKVVYVARDPRDVVVSFYHMALLLSYKTFTGTFRDYWQLFRKDLLTWTPFFEHVKDAWKLREHPNMLFLFYEEMAKDLPAVIHRVSGFFGKQYNEEQVLQLCEHLSFDNFSKNEAVQPYGLDDNKMLNPKEKFIRKGKVGGWREYFVEEMEKEVEEWMAENLKDTDLRFLE